MSGQHALGRLVDHRPAIDDLMAAGALHALRRLGRRVPDDVAVIDFENAAVLRGREQRLVDDKAARLQEWAALPSLSDEVERLRDLLRRHGIDPQDGVA